MMAGTRQRDGRNGGRVRGALHLHAGAIAGHVIISRVPVILHTPLMSGSNFIHGIVLIGAMVVLGHADTTLEKAIGFVAVLLGAGNAAGGYVVTERMLEMFKSSSKPEEEGVMPPTSRCSSPPRVTSSPPRCSCSACSAWPRRSPRAAASSGRAWAW
jgi:NAD(P) transhydrogenase subunit alpha